MFVLFLVGVHWSVLGQNKTDAAGRKQGPWIKYQGDGTTPLYTGTFKDNIPVGEFRYFYPSGKVKMIVKHESDYYNLVGDNYIYFNWWFEKIEE